MVKGRGYGHVFTGADVTDLTNPMVPVLLGHISFGDAMSDFEVTDSNEYMVLSISHDSVQHLEIWDIDPVADAHLVSSVEMPPNNHEIMDVGDGLAVAINSGAKSLQIYDIDPPELLSQPSLVDIPSGSIRYATISKQFIYMSGSDELVHVIDATDPQNPKIVNSVTVPLLSYVLRSEEDYVYAYCRNAESDSYLVGLNVKNPLSPVLFDWIRPMHSARWISLNGPLACQIDDGGIAIINNTQPETASIEGYIAALGEVSHIDVSGDYAVVLDGSYSDGPFGMQVVNIAQPEAAFVTASLNPASQLTDAAVSNGYAYALSEGENGLRIYDIDPPGNPMLVAQVQGGLGLAVEAGYAYVSDGPNLSILDVSTPETPQLVNSVALEKPGCKDVEVSSGYAFILSDFLNIISVAPPENAHPVAHYPEEQGSTNFNDVDTSNGLTCLSSSYWFPDPPGESTYAMHFLDTSTPESPQEVGELSTHDFPFVETSISGQYVYVAAGSHGLIALDVSKPDKPITVTTFDPWGPYHGHLVISVVGDYAYLGGEGIAIVKLF